MLKFMLNIKCAAATLSTHCTSTFFYISNANCTIVDTFKVLGKCCGSTLLKKVLRQQSLLRNQKGCADIVAYLKELNISE